MRAVVAKKRPDWTDALMDRMMALTGDDLAIPDRVLEVVDSIEFHETKTLEELFLEIIQ